MHLQLRKVVFFKLLKQIAKVSANISLEKLSTLVKPVIADFALAEKWIVQESRKQDFGVCAKMDSEQKAIIFPSTAAPEEQMKKDSALQAFQQPLQKIAACLQVALKKVGVPVDVPFPEESEQESSSLCFGRTPEELKRQQARAYLFQDISEKIQFEHMRIESHLEEISARKEFREQEDKEEEERKRDEEEQAKKLERQNAKKKREEDASACISPGQIIHNSYGAIMFRSGLT